MGRDRSGWSRDDDGIYRMTTQVRLRLTHTELAWAIYLAFEEDPAFKGDTLREVDDESGDLTFSRGSMAKRIVRERVLDWLGFKGTDPTDALSEAGSLPPEIYLRAAAVIYGTPTVAQAAKKGEG